MIAKLFRGLFLIVLLALQSCASPLASNSSTSVSVPDQVQVKSGRAPIPGEYWMYSFGPGQTKENFENVDKAQYDYALWPGRHWGAMGALPKGPLGKASANRLGLQVYYPLHVRWKLKDGREFIAENIDVAAIIRESTITRSLKLQWQREGREKAKFGDYDATLAPEVKDDTVILKWVLTINRTPVNERLKPNGAANKWDLYQEEFPVAIIKGVPTSGIDFSKN
jgi:hypothetical protein